MSLFFLNVIHEKCYEIVRLVDLTDFNFKKKKNAQRKTRQNYKSLRFRLQLKCTWCIFVQNKNYLSFNVNFKLPNLLLIGNIKLERHAKHCLVKRNSVLLLAICKWTLKSLRRPSDFNMYERFCCFYWKSLQRMAYNRRQNVWSFLWKLTYCYNCGLIKHDWKQTWFNIITFINTSYSCSILYARIWHIL